VRVLARCYFIRFVVYADCIYNTLVFEDDLRAEDMHDGGMCLEIGCICALAATRVSESQQGISAHE